ncbi:MAG: TIGR03435 family protein [Candidatus Acidiferrales bacterium]
MNRRILFRATIGAAVLVAPGMAAQFMRAQASATDWEKAAGGKMAFEVASVKQGRSVLPPELGQRPTSNVPLGPGDVYSATGGLFIATNIALISYITFAYKTTPDQMRVVRSEVPNWVFSDHFDIHATAKGNPTKDQMRLMMQSLLAERFKLAARIVTRQLPVYALVLVKPGETGPQLQPHSDGTPCDDSCGTFQSQLVSGRTHVVGRDMTMGLIATYLPTFSRTLDRPIIDQTRLSGNFDLTIEFTPDRGEPLPRNMQADVSAPTFLEALKDQLGLKLVATTGAVDFLVIDHIEEPTPN